MPNLLDTIKDAALQAVAEGSPAGLYYGTVESAAPLTINIEQRMTLTAAQLILSSLVQDFDVEMAVSHQTEEVAGGSGDAAFDSHAHAYTGRKTFRVLLGLRVGEKVALISEQGGQRYFVIDRVRS